MKKNKDEDVEVEDIFEDKNKKKINSKIKGKRTELEVVKELNKRFQKILSKNPSWGSFSRTIGSGNRWSHNIFMSKKTMEHFSGDIVCPENFNFVLESKGGYNNIDLYGGFAKGLAEIDKFLKQVTEDSTRTQKKPMLFWKKDYKPRLCFLKSKDLEIKELNKFEYYMKYKEWIIISCKDLFELKDDFFFNQ